MTSGGMSLLSPMRIAGFSLDRQYQLVIKKIDMADPAYSRTENSGTYKSAATCRLCPCCRFQHTRDPGLDHDRHSLYGRHYQSLRRSSINSVAVAAFLILAWNPVNLFTRIFPTFLCCRADNCRSLSKNNQLFPIALREIGSTGSTRPDITPETERLPPGRDNCFSRRACRDGPTVDLLF